MFELILFLCQLPINMLAKCTVKTYMGLTASKKWCHLTHTGTLTALYTLFQVFTKHQYHTYFVRYEIHTNVRQTKPHTVQIIADTKLKPPSTKLFLAWLYRTVEEDSPSVEPAYAAASSVPVASLIDIDVSSLLAFSRLWIAAPSATAAEPAAFSSVRKSASQPTPIVSHHMLSSGINSHAPTYSTSASYLASSSLTFHKSHASDFSHTDFKPSFAASVWDNYAPISHRPW